VAAAKTAPKIPPPPPVEDTAITTEEAVAAEAPVEEPTPGTAEVPAEATPETES